MSVLVRNNCDKLLQIIAFSKLGEIYAMFVLAGNHYDKLLHIIAVSKLSQNKCNICVSQKLL